MFEKSLLAILVLMQAPSWFTVGVSGAGWLASAGAALIEEGVLDGDELWLAVVLNSLASLTLLTLLYVVGPARTRRLEGI